MFVEGGFGSLVPAGSYFWVWEPPYSSAYYAQTGLLVVAAVAPALGSSALVVFRTGSIVIDTLVLASGTSTLNISLLMILAMPAGADVVPALMTIRTVRSP